MEDLWSYLDRKDKAAKITTNQVLKIKITQAEYWDSPNSAVVHLYGVVKAAITGERADPGENKKINL